MAIYTSRRKAYQTYDTKENNRFARLGDIADLFADTATVSGATTLNTLTASGGLTVSAGATSLTGTLATDLTAPTVGAGLAGAAITTWLPLGTIGGASGMKVNEFYIDLTGLRNSGTLNDIIGDNDTAGCHIGQMTDAIFGTIDSVIVICTEAPVTGDADIDFSMSSASTGTENADVTALADYAAVLTAGANWTIGMTKIFTTVPTADFYIYMSDGGAAGGDVAYSAGKFVIRFYGTA